MSLLTLDRRPDARRMRLCLGLAVAIHLVVILGVGFPLLRAPVEKTLRVTFSTAAVERIDDASQMAASAQRGDDEISERKRSRPALANPRLGEQTATETGPAGRSGEASSPVIARSALTPTALSREAGLQAVQGGEEAAAEVRGEDEVKTRTASSDLRAAYLEAWRHAVEDIGNARFPAELLRGRDARQLIIEVWLASTGELLGTRVRNSSGNDALDQRARAIIEDAAPYAAFPAELAARHESLRFAYEWRFLSDSGGG
jgi:protein TonB